MPDLLFLAHRIPYPPDKGDKIRSWHLLKHLTKNWNVHLGAFVDDPDDWRHLGVLRSVCADVKLCALDPRMRKLYSLSGLLRGEALTLPYYRHQDLAVWVRGKMGDGVDAAMVFSSAMAQYVIDFRNLRRVMDFVDIDSDKWRQYAPTKAWPLSWLYRRESGCLLAWERQVAGAFDQSFFVSAAEADDFRNLAPESGGKISYFNNGVDAAYFDPTISYGNPFPAGARAIVFTGAMDYWPNIDAVAWFAKAVLPALRLQNPDVVFYIVGSRPSGEVKALASDAVVVTGRVEDVRPYLAHATVVVAPLRIARGIQNKVLEAMAMSKTVVASPQALEGIAARIGEEILCAESAEEFVSELDRAMTGWNCGRAARDRVLADYSWESSLARLDRWLLAETPA